MIGQGTRKLLNGGSIAALAWLAYVLYGFFTDSGIWDVVRKAFASPYSGRYSPAGTFAACALLGIIPIGAVGWAIWRVFLKARPSP